MYVYIYIHIIVYSMWRMFILSLFASDCHTRIHEGKHKPPAFMGMANDQIDTNPGQAREISRSLAPIR